MNSSALRLLLIVGLGLSVAQAAPQMSESVAEFFASGDFDGDGRLDSVIIDKAAGTMRIGYQTALESWTWVPARPAGAVPVTAAAMGRMLDNARDSIAIASPAANRVLIHPAGSTTTVGTPVQHHDLLGPDAVVAVPLPGAGGIAGRDQLLAGSIIDINASPYSLAGFEPAGGTIFITQAGAPLRRGQPIRLKTGGLWQAAFLADAAGSTSLQVYNGSGLSVASTLNSPNVPAASHFASANFNAGSALAQVLFWTPGAPQLRVRPVTEPVAGAFALGAEITYPLGGNITQLVVLDDPAGPRLLVVFNDGASAGIFTFNGISAPVLVTTFTPTAGERFRAATLGGSGNFILTSSPAASPRSTIFRPYRRASASTYTPLTAISLPVITTNSGRANVLLYSGTPFVNPAAQPLAALRAGDWARSVTLAGGTVSAVVEVFAGTNAGLDNPATVNLGSPVAGTTDVLANQVEPYLSVSSLRPVYDIPGLEPSIAPMPGNFDTAQRLSFSAPPGVFVGYRLGSGPWTLWTGAPVWLINDLTVFYFGSDGVRNSALRQAAYTFEKEGLYLDSDHDGVPDFVELARGLDPRSGPDSDGDSFNDDAELLAGTNPNDRNSPTPAQLPLPPRAANTGVNLTATLRSWRTGAPAPAIIPAAGTRVDAIDTGGALLATRTTAAGSDSVLIGDLAAPRGTRFLSLTTAPSWKRNDGSGIKHASQSIAIVPAPAPPPPLAVNYTPGGGTPQVEANAWVAALATAETVQTPRNIAATLSPIDSLVAMLIEKKLDEILIARGDNPATRLSLFDTGLSDAGARRVIPAQLAALELPGPANQPAWKLDTLHSRIDLGVKATPGSAGVQALRALASDLFEKFDSVWQPPSAANPNGVTAAFPAPIDLLRSTVRGTALPQTYRNVSALSAAQITSAQAAVTAILALPTPRPESTLTLTARADSFRTDCTVFNNGATSVAMVDEEGQPWRFRASIALPAGASLRVRGFTDRPAPPPACAASTLEVITATVLTLPSGPLLDNDGDGLGDEWELAFFGNLNQTGSGDFDGDGRTNALEHAAGTDPADRPPSVPAPVVEPPFANLAAPELSITLNATGLIELSWQPSPSAPASVIYTLESNPGLEGEWAKLSDLPEQLPDGRLMFTVKPESSGRNFFRVRVRVAQP